MKTFNLLNEIIVLDKAALLRAINAASEFAVTISGDIVTGDALTQGILIFKGSAAPVPASPLRAPAAPDLGNVFGEGYRVVEDDDRVLIKAAGAWRNSIIALNLPRCDYDDTSADGLSYFSDAALEEIGWHATEFGIDYREIVGRIESDVPGTLLCIEQAEPYQFSGMGFIDDREQARRIAFDFCKEKITALMEEDADYAPEGLSGDERDTAVYFGLLQ